MFWERFEKLCNKQNIKPNPLAKNIGISSGSISKWKAGSTPNGESLLTIANHFNCSIDYLLGRTDNPKIIQEIDKKNFSPEDFELLSIFHELSKEQKIKCLAYLRGFVDNENSKKNDTFYNSKEKAAGK